MTTTVPVCTIDDMEDDQLNTNDFPIQARVAKVCSGAPPPPPPPPPGGASTSTAVGYTKGRDRAPPSPPSPPPPGGPGIYAAATEDTADHDCRDGMQVAKAIKAIGDVYAKHVWQAGLKRLRSVSSTELVEIARSFQSDIYREPAITAYMAKCSVMPLHDLHALFHCFQSDIYREPCAEAYIRQYPVIPSEGLCVVLGSFHSDIYRGAWVDAMAKFKTVIDATADHKWWDRAIAMFTIPMYRGPAATILASLHLFRHCQTTRASCDPVPALSTPVAPSAPPPVVSMDSKEVERFNSLLVSLRSAETDSMRLVIIDTELAKHSWTSAEIASAAATFQKEQTGRYEFAMRLWLFGTDRSDARLNLIAANFTKSNYMRDAFVCDVNHSRCRVSSTPTDVTSTEAGTRTAGEDRGLPHASLAISPVQH